MTVLDEVPPARLAPLGRESVFGGLVTPDPWSYVWGRLRALLTMESMRRYADMVSPELHDLLDTDPDEARLQLLTSSSVVRRELCEDDMLAFAVVYMPHHLRDQPDYPGAPQKPMTLTPFHTDVCQVVESWLEPNTTGRGRRCAIIGPRKIGKSTWCFTIAPMWALAFGHKRYVIAFSDAASQAEEHLATFRSELDTNEYLRADFPDLCTPKRKRNGFLFADRVDKYVAASGAAFVAKGLDAKSLGTKIATGRPDLIVVDEPEPDESHYSKEAVEKRKLTLIDSVFYLNENADVLISGTVVMSGSIIHQLVQAGRGAAPEPWITEQAIDVHYWPGLIQMDDGTKVSIWPTRKGWSTEELLAREHTRDFQKNFQNAPVPKEQRYWYDEVFRYGTIDTLTRTVIAIDGNVRTKKTADWTAFAVVSYSALHRKALVRAVVRARPRNRAERVAIVKFLLRRFPSTRSIVVEGNNGGDLWVEAIPEEETGIPVTIFYKTESKEHGASRLLDLYERECVVHEEPFPETEQQMKEFPFGSHDDDIDAILHGTDALVGTGPFVHTKLKVRIR